MRRITLLSIAAAIAISLGGCTDAGRSLIILQNQVPDDSCVVSDSASNIFRPVGSLDLRSPGGYLFLPLVQNVAEGVRNDPSARLVTIQGADVEILFQDGFEPGEVRDTAISVPSSGFVGPDGDTVPVPVTVVSANLARDLQGTLATDGTQTTFITARVSVFGEMDGGTVESRPFDYPIQVCDGCLLLDLGPCDALAPGYVGTSEFPCRGYIQDGLVECCTASNGEKVCPAVSTGTGG